MQGFQLMFDEELIRRFATSLPSQGATRRMECPACGRRTMSVTVLGSTGAYHCHRASCGVSGWLEGSLRIPGEEKPASTELRRQIRPYSGHTLPLASSAGWVSYFADRFHIKNFRDRWVYLGDDGLVLPIFSPIGAMRGVLVRTKPWKPLHGLITPPPCCDGPGPKTMTYPEVPTEPLISWYAPAEEARLPINPLVVVEDQMSAIRLASEGIRSVALLGTHMNLKVVSEIAREGLRTQVILALDADATEKALDLACKWGPAFEWLRVAVLVEDLKDAEDPIADVLGLYA